MSQSQYNYMRSFDVPVLIAQPHVSSGELYAAWLHSRPIRQTDSGKSLRFELDDDDLWTEATPAVMVESVKAYRSIHRKSAFNPLEISVTTPDAQVVEVDANELVHAMSGLLSEMSHLASVRGGPASPEVAAITLLSDGIRVGLGEVASNILPPGRVGSKDGYRYLAADLLYCLAELLAVVGYRGLGVKLATIVIAKTVHTRRGPHGLALAAAAARDPLLLEEALRLGDVLGENDHPMESFLIDQLLDASPRLPSRELSMLTDFLRRRRERQPSVPLESIVRVVSQRLMGEHRAVDAAAVWRIADAVDRGAANDYPSLRTRAGAEFLALEFASSASHYEAALEVAPANEKSKVKALLGDAYLKIGRLQDARDYFAADLEDPEWHLKHLATSYLIETLGVSELASVPDFVHAGSVDFSKAESAEDVVQRAVEDAAQSGPDSLLWYKAASRLTELREFRLTAEFSMIAAVLGDPVDPESLALAIVRWLSLATDANPPDGALATSQLLLQVAAHRYGNSILAYYQDDEVPPNMLAMITEMIELFAKNLNQGHATPGTNDQEASDHPAEGADAPRQRRLAAPSPTGTGTPLP